ncbi:B12-binding domain-containing radical SAM protein [Desulfovibrio sp. OttesenSCG-928-A18]|nr:B12-binding domain-containing radical SAM protein [Desulfovibrio sp. OttesenSCG-928-A18]
MPRKILLVAARDVRGSYWNMHSVIAFAGKKALTAPLGLLQVAAMLPRQSYEPRLLDMNIEELDDSDLAWADALFISGMSTAARSIAELIQRARAMGRPVIVGGAHATTEYHAIKDADCLFIGEAEGIWEVFLRDFEAGRLKKAYAHPGTESERKALVAFFGDSAHIATDKPFPELDATPSPRYDLADLDAYYLIPMQTTRGCPKNCEFCDIWLRHGRKPRHRAPERIIADLDELYRLGARGNIFFSDDNIIGDREYARTLLTAVTRWQVRHRRPYTFSGEASLDLAEDMEMLELFAAAKLLFVFVGLETPSSESLKEANKQVNLKGSMEERVAILQGQGIQVTAGFIVGFDSDPDDIPRRMSDAALVMGIPIIMTGILLALPGTRLTMRLQQEGRLFDAHALYSNSHSFIPNFQSAKPLPVVAAAYRATLQGLYPHDMGNYFERCRVFLDRRSNKRRPLQEIFDELAPGVQPDPAIRLPSKKASLSDIKSLLILLGRTLAAPHRAQAFRFLLHIWRQRREHIKTALFLTALALHLRQTTQAYMLAASVWDNMRAHLESLMRGQNLQLPRSAGIFGITDLDGGGPNKDEAAESPKSGKRPGERANACRRSLARIEWEFKKLPPEHRQLLQEHFTALREDIEAACAD